MGRTYQFECPKCEYRARVSGGPDRGVQVVVQTIHCQDCKALYDAVIAVKTPVAPEPEPQPEPKPAEQKPDAKPVPPKPVRAPTFASAVNRLPPIPLKRTEWKKFPLMCPISSLHRIKDWKQPGRCPRCGVYLEPGSLPFRLWD